MSGPCAAKATEFSIASDGPRPAGRWPDSGLRHLRAQFACNHFGRQQRRERARLAERMSLLLVSETPQFYRQTIKSFSESKQILVWTYPTQSGTFR
jgi:hypothetical protein